MKEYNQSFSWYEHLKGVGLERFSKSSQRSFEEICDRIETNYLGCVVTKNDDKMTTHQCFKSNSPSHWSEYNDFVTPYSRAT
eukprot:CCRYP_007202-RA/>CCRYP_007202-RA protein AED:0.08 eAED:0.13 QI:0/0/0.5/1/0/0/2/1467/81